MQRNRMHGCWETVEMFVIIPGEFHISSCEGLITRRDEDQTEGAPIAALLCSLSRKQSEGKMKYYIGSLDELLWDRCCLASLQGLFVAPAWAVAHEASASDDKKEKKNNQWQMPVMGWAKLGGDARFILKHTTTVFILVCGFRKLPLCIMLYALCCYRGKWRELFLGGKKPFTTLALIHKPCCHN